jgi:hypothetical protein
LAKVAAVAAVLLLLGGAAAEQAQGARWRLPAFWGFVLSSAIAWSAAPSALEPARIDVLRGTAGMLGWALFAFASAAPAIPAASQPERVVEEAPLVPRRRLHGADVAYVSVGALFALALQLFGWRVAGAERALLVRLVALATGLAILGATTDLAIVRHAPRARRSRGARLRSATSVLLLLAVLGLVGALSALRG